MAQDPFDNLSEQDILQMIRDIRKEGRPGTSQEVPPPGETVTPPQPVANETPRFTITIGGRPFSGTQDEIQTAIQAEENRLRSTAPAPVARNERRVTAEDNYDPEETRRELAARLEKDPRAAWQYMNEKVFGVADPAAIIRTSAQAIAEQQVQLSALNFRFNHPEWHPSEANVNVLSQVMQEHGIPATNLEMAYEIAKGRNLLKFNDKEEAQPQGEVVDEQPRPQLVPQTRRPAAPPRVTRNAPAPSAVSDEEAQAVFQDMSLEEMVALDRKIRASVKR